MVGKIIKNNKIWILLRLFWTVFFLWFSIYLFSFGQTNVSKSLPKEYIANYSISADWEKVQQLFVEIESATKIWSEIPISKFSSLNASFNNIFKYFPQDYNFKVTYQDCLSLSKDLSLWYTYNKLTSFMDTCYKPLKQILDKINTKYTVSAEAKVNPKAWPTPLIVTFDARASVDPSNETIPNNNYYRYYRDINWLDKTMWIGPVLNYSFDSPWNYLVHLTIRSSNNLTKWIFDWSKNISIDVSPKVASVVVYANWKKLDKYNKVKLWIQEAQKWIIFDPSATIAMWWRILQSYKREIKSSDGFSYLKQWQWKPSIMNLALPWEWEFTISLTVSDNENNNTTEKFFLIVSDPVAIIKQSPEIWNTATTFAFDSSTSYSIVSNIKLYTRELFDENWDKIDMIQWKTIKKQFKKPWLYVVKLSVEDELWQINVDSLNLLVESTDPVPQFATNPTLLWKFPSQYVLDASLSSDVDAMNWYDELSYEWNFDKSSFVQIIKTEDNNKRITVNFDDIWKHKIKLTVKDKYGKISEIEKEIDIKSTLRPEILSNPKAAIWWTPVDFTVTSNKEILNYSWDFVDWNSATVQTNKITHTYKKIWNYNVKLQVYDSNWMQNEINELVFIWEKNSPIAWYKVQDSKSMTMTQDDVCEFTVWTRTIKYPAYKVDRYKDFKIDPSDSVNVKWEKSNLFFYFQPKNWEIYKQQQFTYKFDEVGCIYVDFTAEDASVSKNSIARIRFRVYNALPKLDNLVLMYPQYGNEVWVWFKENNVQDIFNSELDPLIVKVMAVNPIDSDWFISYYKWYYYYKDDPTRQLEIKITPSTIPYAFFSLPRMPWEFMFGVTMYDSDDWRQSSEDIIWNWPLVLFPPDAAKPDFPMVTLRSDKTSVEIWDDVTFDVISKVVSDRPDFIKDRTIQYDFDWDGTYDLITKKDRITYAYTTPNATWYTPRAAVLYRWYKGIGKWSNIIVKNWLKPRLLMKLYDRLLLIRDVSLWDISKDDICLSLVDCKKWDNEFLYSWKELQYIAHEYPNYKKYVVSVDLQDRYANIASKKWTVDVISGTTKSTDVEILSLPELSDSEAGKEIFVWNNLNNSVLFYIYYAWTKDCYVDKDISFDSDNDNNAANDNDFVCNKSKLVEYNPLYQSIVWRVFYKMDDTQTLSKDFTVSFLDISLQLDEETKLIQQDLMKLINSLDISKDENKGLKSLLLNLQQNLIDTTNMKSDLVAVQSFVRDNKIALDKDQTSLFDSIVSRLQSKASVAAMWWNEYQQSKAEILNIIPFSMRAQIEDIFTQFESVAWDASWNNTQQDKRKILLNQILTEIGKKVVILQDWQQLKSDEIDSVDMELTIIPNMCKIMTYYWIPSEKCSSDQLKTVPVWVAQETTWMSKLVKTLLIVLWVLVWWFVVVIIVFAVKSKLMKKEEETEEI